MSPGCAEPDEHELPPPGSILARYAALVAQGFPLDYCLRLTPAQITAVHGHKRDEHGNIEPPAPRAKQLAPTLQNKLIALDRIAGTGLIPESEYRRARAEILAAMGQAAPTKPERPAPQRPRPARPPKR